jgi:hypothetical protein
MLDEEVVLSATCLASHEDESSSSMLRKPSA